MRILVPLALLQLACVGAPPARTLQVRAFLGADDQGGWAYAEATVFPGEAPRGSLRQILPGGAQASQAPLSPERVDIALARATLAGDGRQRTAEESLAPVRPSGFDPARATVLAAGEGVSRWQIKAATDLPAELELRREAGELRVLVRLVSGDEEIVAYRLAEGASAWVSAILLLPGGRRALTMTGAATRSLGALHRMESLGEVDIGGALAALLDARALKRIETGALEGATSDLQRAVTIAPADATAHYNLACAYALSGDADQALVSLGHAVDLDPDQYKSFAMTDPDLASLRARTEFRLMVEPRAPGAVP